MDDYLEEVTESGAHGAYSRSNCVCSIEKSYAALSIVVLSKLIDQSYFIHISALIYLAALKGSTKLAFIILDKSIVRSEL